MPYTFPVSPEGSVHELFDPKYNHVGDCGKQSIHDGYLGSILARGAYPENLKEGWYWAPLADGGHGLADGATLPGVQSNVQRPEFVISELVFNGRFDIHGGKDAARGEHGGAAKDWPGYQWTEGGEVRSGFDRGVSLRARDDDHNNWAATFSPPCLAVAVTGSNACVARPAVTLRHAPTYIPEGFDRLTFSYLLRHGRTDTFEVSLKTVDGTTVLSCNSLSLGHWGSASCAIPPHFIGASPIIQFKFIPGDADASVGSVDDIGFGRSTGIEAHVMVEPIRVEVAAASATAVVQQLLSGKQAAGSSTLIHTVDVQISESGYGSWTLVPSDAWVAVSPSILPAAGGSVSVTMDPSFLEPGTHAAYISLIPTGWDGSTASGGVIPIQLSVGAAEGLQSMDGQIFLFADGTAVTFKGVVSPPGPAFLSIATSGGIATPSRIVMARDAIVRDLATSAPFTEATIRMPFDAASIPQGSAAVVLRIFGQEATEVPATFDYAAGVAEFKVRSLGRFAIGLTQTTGCGFVVSAQFIRIASGGGTASFGVHTDDETCRWTAISSTQFAPVDSSSRVGSGAFTLTLLNNPGSARIAEIELAGTLVTVVQDAAPVTPSVSVDRAALAFAAIRSVTGLASQTPAQTVRLAQSAGPAVTWTATSDRPWLSVAPSSGAGPSRLTVAVAFHGSLPPAGVVAGTITLSVAGATVSTVAIPVTLTIGTIGAAASPPFGVFDTPIGDGAVLAGSIAVTGWALDNVSVTRVELWRDLQPGEPTAPFIGAGGDPRNGKVFISNATFVDGARPDIEALYPGAPFGYRAGWGYLLLTWGLWNEGNGTYRLWAFAFDAEQNVATIGSKTIIVNNSIATKPFGSIDTPAIGADAEGPNFGWALTPMVGGAATCRIKPSGVQVSIDSGPLQPVVYGGLRSDVAARFPAFSNSTGAGGHFIFDWSTLSSGAHTIAWVATDDCNRADGIGSRYFTVINGTDAQTLLVAQRSAGNSKIAGGGDESDESITVAFSSGEAPHVVMPDQSGTRIVRLKQGDRIELRAPSSFTTAYQIGPGGVRRDLPIGASWDAAVGVLYWQPAPGFLGVYQIVFANGAKRLNVRIIVTP
jgi:hypothetical protein